VKLGRRFLEKLGYEVTGETSSRRALELFSRDPGRFDLIVTDQTMPQLTGVSLAESVWRLRPGLPIVISTGYSEQINPERSSALGFSALLPKPYSLPELSRAVEHCMEKGDAGQNTG
jgi:CheY-like chemotaxis protein